MHDLHYNHTKEFKEKQFKEWSEKARELRDTYTKEYFFSISYILVFAYVPILNFSVLGSLSNIVSIYSIYFSIFTIITNLLSLFFSNPYIPLSKKKKRL